MAGRFRQSSGHTSSTCSIPATIPSSSNALCEGAWSPDLQCVTTCVLDDLKLKWEKKNVSERKTFRCNPRAPPYFIPGSFLFLFILYGCYLYLCFTHNQRLINLWRSANPDGWRPFTLSILVRNVSWKPSKKIFIFLTNWILEVWLTGFDPGLFWDQSG